MNEPDRAAGDENAYEQRLHVSSGLCVRCGNDAAVPDDPDDFCRACIMDVEGVIASVVDNSGYELDDPKSPTYHERMADYADLERDVA